MYAWVVGAVVRRAYAEAIDGRPRLIRILAAPDVRLAFPGRTPFGGSYEGRDAVLGWIERFASLQPRFDVVDVVVSGAPWRARVAVRFRDAIGSDYRNEGIELIRLRAFRIRSIDVALDTERLARWSQQHPEAGRAVLADAQ